MKRTNNIKLKKNNFDLIRLILAGTVCLIHGYDLSGLSELSWTRSTYLSSIAVKAFFVVSGFLIFMSYERTTSLKTYAIKRFRRIYPAYFVIVIICALGMIGLSTKSIIEYFSIDWIKYVTSNLSFLNFLHPTLPGVFESNPQSAVNGALWTIKIEVLFYLSVPLFVWLFRRHGTLKVLVISYSLSIFYYLICSYLAKQTDFAIFGILSRQLPAQLSYFLSGAFFYYYMDIYERYEIYFLIFATILLVINSAWPIPFFEPFALATVVIFAAFFVYLGNFGKFGDFSYGVYIVHFPIFQTLIHKGYFINKPLYFMAVGITLTLISSILMWHLVEKRFLLKSSHYIGATSFSKGE